MSCGTHFQTHVITQTLWTVLQSNLQRQKGPQINVEQWNIIRQELSALFSRMILPYTGYLRELSARPSLACRMAKNGKASYKVVPVNRQGRVFHTSSAYQTLE